MDDDGDAKWIKDFVCRTAVLPVAAAEVYVE